jgi:hypothetical protein
MLRRPFLALGFLALTASPALAQSPIRFEDATAAAGMKDTLAGIMGHGGAWGDYDGDGHVDLFVGGFCDRPDAEYAPSKDPVPTHLFRNLGRGQFERAKGECSFFARSSGAVFVDLDNDGLLELYVANNARQPRGPLDTLQARAKVEQSRLLSFSGGQWWNVTERTGACPKELLSARNIAPLDYNFDGRLDLLVIEDRFVRNPQTRLLRGDGEMRFTDVTIDAGIPSGLFGLGCAVGDINDDKRPDIFIGHSNRWLLSTKDGKFVEDAELNKTFAWRPLHGEDWPCGAALGDLNRDGLLDLVLAIHGVPARNKVYLNGGINDGVPRFRDVTEQTGMPSEVPVKCPHVEIQDFDNDGWPDVYISAAWKNEDSSVTPLILRHTGLKGGVPRFELPRPIGENMVYYPAGPSADYDNDGRIDLFLINWFQGDSCHLLRNVTKSGNWTEVQVSGKGTTPMGIGTRVSIYEAGKAGDPKSLLGCQQIQTGYGYASGQPAIAHFGVGERSKVDLVLDLPRQGKVSLDNMPVNRRFTNESP